MVFGTARTSLALGNTIVETQNEEMLHQAFFELLSQRFSAAARQHPLRPQGGGFRLPLHFRSHPPERAAQFHLGRPGPHRQGRAALHRETPQRLPRHRAEILRKRNPRRIPPPPSKPQRDERSPSPKSSCSTDVALLRMARPRRPLDGVAVRLGHPRPPAAANRTHHGHRCEG